METLNLTVTVDRDPSAVRKGVNNESEDKRIARLTAFYAAKENSKFYAVGQLLATAHKGKTLAAHLADGAEFAMGTVSINGVSYPLREGFVLSLDTVAKGETAWGCVACRSAHGSGVAPSKAVNVKTLASNQFYYNPATKDLFTVSATCWNKYVADSPFNATKRFVKAPKANAATKGGN